MDKKYIADAIQLKDIQNWNIGDKILINAPTGSGKTHFIINNLYKYAKFEKEKILFLTNRIILKKQIKKDINKKNNIKVLSYQQLTKILKRVNFNIAIYKYVIVDECHFFFSDSYFNIETDITLEYLTNLKNNITLYLSATCEVFKNYIQKLYNNIKCYSINNQLMYNNLYYFENQETILKLLANLPLEEKVIYFCSNISNAYNLYKKFKTNSTFLCSENNKKYSCYSDSNTKKTIIEQAKFDNQILFTTKILDNGINIKDKQLKHIIIDIFDFDTIQQCIGRKRILDNDDKINIYIKKFKQNSVQSYMNQWKKILKFGDEFKKLNQENYLYKNSRKNTNGLIYTSTSKDKNVILKLNNAYYYKLNYDINISNTITDINKNSNKKLGHLQILCNRYNIELSNFKCLDDDITTNTFNDQLSNYLNIKMFKEEQKEFKEFIKKNAVKVVDNKHNSMGINVINGYFEDNNILYRLQSIQETVGENRNKRYWKLFKLI